MHIDKGRRELYELPGFSVSNSDTAAVWLSQRPPAPQWTLVQLAGTVLWFPTGERDGSSWPFPGPLRPSTDRKYRAAVRLCALSCIRGRALDGLPGASSIAESRGSVPGPIFSYFPNKSECVPVRYSMRVFPSTR